MEPMVTCEWVEDYDGNWDTACGGKHILLDSSPHANGMMFCCYCGKASTERRYDDGTGITADEKAWLG